MSLRRIETQQDKYIIVIARRGEIPSLRSEQAWQSHKKDQDYIIFLMRLPRVARNDKEQNQVFFKG